VDRVSGEGEHRVEGGLLLAPGWSAEAAPGGWLLAAGGMRLRVRVRGPEGLALSAEARPYHPEFGTEETTVRLCWGAVARLPVETVIDIDEA
jgi:hypothetical protein